MFGLWATRSRLTDYNGWIAGSTVRMAARGTGPQSDDDYADTLVKASFDVLRHAMSDGRNTKGGFYAADYLSATCHICFSSTVGQGPRSWRGQTTGPSKSLGRPSVHVRSISETRIDVSEHFMQDGFSLDDEHRLA